MVICSFLRTALIKGSVNVYFHIRQPAIPLLQHFIVSINRLEAIFVDAYSGETMRRAFGRG